MIPTSTKLDELVNKFYSGEVGIISEIAELLKHNIAAAINTADLKIKDVQYDRKSKSILLHFTFNHKYFSRDGIIVIKFSEQRSKSVVPAQVRKFLKVIQKRILNVDMKNADVTIILLVPKYTSGVARMNDDIRFNSKVVTLQGKFLVTTPSRLLNDLDTHLLKYLRDRIIGFVKKAKSNIENGKKYTNIVEAISKLVTLLSALKHVLYNKRLLLPYEVKELVISLLKWKAWKT
jgi:hypothetical protein